MASLLKASAFAGVQVLNPFVHQANDSDLLGINMRFLVRFLRNSALVARIRFDDLAIILIVVLIFRA